LRLGKKPPIKPEYGAIPKLKNAKSNYCFFGIHSFGQPQLAMAQVRWSGLNTNKNTPLLLSFCSSITKKNVNYGYGSASK
jgi:hypothetical protein